MNYIAGLILIIFSIVTSYCIVRYLNLLIRTRKLIFNNYYKINKFINKFNNSYNLDPKYLFCIKYVFSILFFFIILIRFNNLIFSIIIFLILFFIPDLLIYIRRKKENLSNLTSLKILVSNLNLSLSSNIVFYKSLKMSISILEDSNFKNILSKFMYNYEINNFNINLAVESVEKDVEFLEGKVFFDILIDSDKEGNMIENLYIFEDVLKISYFKILKVKESKRMFYIIIAAFISIINLVITAMFPILTQIINSLNIILN